MPHRRTAQDSNTWPQHMATNQPWTSNATCHFPEDVTSRDSYNNLPTWLQDFHCLRAWTSLAHFLKFKRERERKKERGGACVCVRARVLQRAN